MEDFDDIVQSPNDKGSIDLSHRAWVKLDDAIWSWGRSLISLNVSFNNIVTISPKLGELACVRELDFSCNKIENIPPELGQCMRLRSLKLNGNRLKTLPSTIGTCRLLEEIVASENEIIKLPGELGNLSVLRVLKMQNNKLVELPPELGDCLILENIDCTNNANISNVPQEVLSNASLLTWMCRHNKQHRTLLQELESTNVDLENAAELTAETGLGMREQIESLEMERNRLLKERPENYLQLRDHARRVNSVLCIIQ